jgi:transposase
MGGVKRFNMRMDQLRLLLEDKGSKIFMWVVVNYDLNNYYNHIRIKCYFIILTAGWGMIATADIEID